MVDSTTFMQCVCTGYYEIWILSLPPFIINSCSYLHTLRAGRVMLSVVELLSYLSLT